jgi:hypothetical protein
VPGKTKWHRVVIYSEGLAKVAEQYLEKTRGSISKADPAISTSAMEYCCQSWQLDHPRPSLSLAEPPRGDHLAGLAEV